MEKKIGFINGRELKKGDHIEYQIKRLAGVDYNPPIIHRGTVVTPVYQSKPYWVAQVMPDKGNKALPDWDLAGGGVMAIEGSNITKIS